MAAALAEHIRKIDEEKWGRRGKRVNRWELIRRENPQKKPAPRAVRWADQEPESESESDEERAEVRESNETRESELPHEARPDFRGGFGRGRDSGRGRGRGRGGHGQGRGHGHVIADDDGFVREVSDW